MIDIDIDKLEELREEADRRFIELHEAYKSELFLSAPALIAEVRRLRAIEAAARDIAQVTEERDDPWVCVPITARQWDALKAALAAKDML
jgi:hypothetical protein